MSRSVSSRVDMYPGSMQVYPESIHVCPGRLKCAHECVQEGQDLNAELPPRLRSRTQQLSKVRLEGWSVSRKVKMCTGSMQVCPGRLKCAHECVQEGQDLHAELPPRLRARAQQLSKVYPERCPGVCLRRCNCVQEARKCVQEG